MSAAKHTPGPWIVSDDDGVVFGRDGYQIAAFSPRNREGNLSLAGSAPEMLEALRALHEQLDGTAVLAAGNGDRTRASEVHIEDLRAWAKIAEGAIAKAEGGSGA